MTERKSIFTQYAYNLSHNKNAPAILKDNPQIPLILDTLGRKQRHHVVLLNSFAEKINLAIMESIAHALSSDFLPKTLRETDVVYFDATRFALCTELPHKIEQEFRILCEQVRASNKRIIFGINHLLCKETENSLSCLENLLKSLLSDEKWRFIVLTSPFRYQECTAHLPYINEHFYPIKLSEPGENEILALLKACRNELESFHQILIPEETFAFALFAAKNYLSGPQHCFDKALELLDSGAARASSAERMDPTGQYKPVLTNAILANIVSNWTGIPTSHLQPNKLKSAEFAKAIQRQVYGQESAINLIGSILQHGRIKFQEKSGPLCSFLFAGPQNVGKTQSAYAMAEQLFGHKYALLHINLDKTHLPSSLTDIKVMTEAPESNGTSLLSAIQQTPYAVVLLENINQATLGAIHLFEDIFTYGYATDSRGNRYDFRNAIIVITTTLGTERILNLTQPQRLHEAAQPMDLLQLVLNEAPTDLAPHTIQHLSTQELCEAIMPTLETLFSPDLLRHLNIVPFVPLDYAAIEKIIRLKLKTFAKQLDTKFGIELSYVPEIIRFLSQEALWRRQHIKSIDKLLEQHLYTSVAHEILMHAEDKNRPKHLHIQLNDAGQLLRCELATAGDAAVHK